MVNKRDDDDDDLRGGEAECVCGGSPWEDG